MELSLTSICLFNEYNISSNVKQGRDQQKIKRNLKLLNSYLGQYSLLNFKWISTITFKGLIFAFNHGIISSVCFDQNFSILYISHDQFIMNKLSSKRISAIEITEKFILISYFEPQLVYISLEDNFKSEGTYKKFKLNKNCSIKNINIDKFLKKSTKRNLAVSDQFALVWWNRTPYRNSWNTQSSDFDNLLVFNFDDLSVADFCSIDGEIIQADFVAKESCKFGVLYKQKSSAYNLTYQIYELTIQPKNENCTKKESTEITKLNVKMKLIFEIGIPMEKLCLSAQFTQYQDKILILCDDDTAIMFNVEQNALYSLDSSIPICFTTSYPLDSMFATCDRNGLISFYDAAFKNLLYKIRYQGSTLLIKSHEENCTSSNMSVKRFKFLSPNILATFTIENRQKDLKVKIAKSGLLTLGRSNDGSSNKICFKLTILPHRITFERLINEYLYLSKYEEALDMLRIINWNCSYDEAFLCLNIIFEHLMKTSHETENESYIESTLAAFLIPVTPIDYKIFEKILPYMRQLAIRFFYHLVKNGSLHKAYQLAIELKSPRLFLLLTQIFKMNDQEEFASKCYEQARNLI